MQSGHKTKVHVMRTVHQKPHYISEKYSPPITSLALLLITRLFFHNQNYSPFLLQVTKGESLRKSHLIIMCRARSIITIIISIIKGLCKRIRHGEGAKPPRWDCRRDTTNPSVHLTHLIRTMVKTTTKIITHKVNLIHDGNDRCLYFERRRWSKCRRGLRGIASIFGNSNISLLLLSGSWLFLRPFGLKS